ncbi:conserved hypothetical protein [Formosa agariphila KMM 3901]|uniref:TonB-dependent receptor n=1 Tax=Formosa agariphila (strain DSM 15362 / KCTC 12365 / LMG 23005 / KMM 3901 / M-2Alg 35-1) TaxID=1347342 RepID=T2KR28_FORAG|nr:hypothetical protein [Formosa agariphila]CDF80968.1 conserved hypothetical protein [Formosa agariphila KMM 3901]
MKFIIVFLCFSFSLCVFSQEQNTNYKTKKVAVKDTIVIDSVSINPNWFTLKTTTGTAIDSSLYTIDFPKATLTFKQPIETDSILISYLKFPDFLTKTYRQLDESIILSDINNQQKLYKLSQPTGTKKYIPFDGLSTSGSISRGVTVGNNQNSVLNSELDLQITGKLNDKISLRASIQDANIPLQESGYSQRLDEFDQVFIEIFSDTWNIRAGDVDLQKTNTFFANFSKRVQGLSLNATLNHEQSTTNLFAAGAIVRGQFTRSQFTAQEGNQGPYKLKGPNDELFVLIVSGSETVYVNGIALERGENNDYIIDYNAGEIIFNSTFPVTSEMRITVDFQYSERNYSRIIAYGGGQHESKKFNIGASVYSENDSKNNPLQQNLSTEQVDILANAGDDSSKMISASETPEAFNENRILYKKETFNSETIYVFSNNPDDELYSVTFSTVGDNQGHYILSDINAINNIYEYISPVNGIPQGNYAPVTQLIAPTKLQIAVVNGTFKPSKKTNIYFEGAGSKNDLNLFSDLDDANNDGFAGKLKINQNIINQDSLWTLNAFADFDYIEENFRTIEVLYNTEFNRDWNIENTVGNQKLLVGGLQLQLPEKVFFNYQFEHLSYHNNFNGNRHVANGVLHLNRFNFYTVSSFLNSESDSNTSTFLRSSNTATYSFGKPWVGAKFAIEDNQQQEKITERYLPTSQKFKSYEAFTGIGDSTKIFAEVGFKYRINDSIRNNELQHVNTSKTYYLDSRLVQNTNTNLSLYVNYRTLDNVFEDHEQSLNSRLIYNQNFFKQIVQWNTIFETNSGTLPQQDFTYVEVEPGQGGYTWIDYNENGIQELEEFELAQFQDEGKYIRVLLPNQVYIKTHQNRFSQTLTLNPQQWVNSGIKFKSFLSQFYNQTAYLIDRKTYRDGNNFQINPFKADEENQLGLVLNVRNVLFFNRGKQHYTTSYTFLKNRARSILTIGFIENNVQSHQLNFNHKFGESWLITLLSSLSEAESISENYVSKNFNIDETQFNPKLTYLLNENTRFDVFYQFTNKENTIGSFETLEQQKYGASLSISNVQKSAISGEFNYFSNAYSGNANTPVAYQMLEGLQPGKNFTWTMLVQKKITKFLDLNLSYFGRKSETSKSIHTGSVQLKAYF